MKDIRLTTAYSNVFFDRAIHKPGNADLSRIVTEWFPVTQAFCLSLPGYLDQFAQEVTNASESRRDALEEAMLIPLAIASEEFGMGNSGVEGIHYRMFARLGEPLGLSVNSLRLHQNGTLPETAALVTAIRRTLKTLLEGAGCLRVVEGTAYQIVEAMDSVFRSATDTDGNRLYDEYRLGYISLHLEIEKEHDLLSASLLDKLCVSEKDIQTADQSIDLMTRLFGDYWAAMSTFVFCENHQSTRQSCSAS